MTCCSFLKKAHCSPPAPLCLRLTNTAVQQDGQSMHLLRVNAALLTLSSCAAPRGQGAPLQAGCSLNVFGPSPTPQLHFSGTNLDCKSTPRSPQHMRACAYCPLVNLVDALATLNKPLNFGREIHPLNRIGACPGLRGRPVNLSARPKGPWLPLPK
jgi:hypothetical protein